MEGTEKYIIMIKNTSEFKFEYMSEFEFERKKNLPKLFQSSRNPS
jgi:hypothetical protein